MSRNANTNRTGPSQAKDELGNPLAVKREFANQDDAASQRIYDLLNAVNRSQSPPEDDRLTVKRELETQDRASAQKMYELLDAVNKGQNGPSNGRIKRDSEGGRAEPNNTSSSSSQTGTWSRAPRYSAPESDRDRDGRDRDERGGGRERERDPREWRDGERGREPASGDRKRSLGYHDGREREDRGSYDRDHREYPDKRSRANYR